MSINFAAFNNNVLRCNNEQRADKPGLKRAFQNNADVVSFSGRESKDNPLKKCLKAAALALPLALSTGTPSLANNVNQANLPATPVESPENIQLAQYYPNVTTGLDCIREFLENGNNLNVTSNPAYFAKFTLNTNNQLVYSVRPNLTGEIHRFLVNEYQEALVNPNRQDSYGNWFNYNNYLEDSIIRFNNRFHCEDGSVVQNNIY